MSDYPRIDVRALMEDNPELEDMEDGEQRSMNHERCPAGQDTKSRLFIKREGGKVLTYCHNCQGRGVKSIKRSFRRTGGANLQLEAMDLALPKDIQFFRPQQPVEHIVWLEQYGLSHSLQLAYRIGFSEHWGRTILPVYDDDMRLIAFQRRRVLKHDVGPKYLTTRLRHIKNPVFKANLPHPARKALVLTEDILSAIRIQAAQESCDAWSLLGTYMTNSVVDQVAKHGYERVVIWLDDDNRAVRKSQNIMRRKLSQVADPHIIKHKYLGLRPHEKSDPKVFSDARICKVLEGVT